MHANDDAQPSWTEYRAALTRFTDALDAVLAEGAAADRRHAQLAEQGDALLRAARLPRDPAQLSPGQRHIHERLVRLMQVLYQHRLGLVSPPTHSTRSAAPRALSSRHRI